MTPYFDAVIFDCDGVLVDSETLAMNVSQRMVANLGWHVDLHTMMKMFVGCSEEFFKVQVEKHIGRELEPGWTKPYDRWLKEAFRTELHPIPGITDALDEIALPTAVASNSRHERIRMSLQTVGLLQRFDGRISSAEDVAAGKPEPDVYLHAAGILHVPPRRCIAVDDSTFGITAAHRAGMYVLAYGGHGDAEKLPRGDRIFPLRSMKELPDVLHRLTSTGTPQKSSTASPGRGSI